MSPALAQKRLCANKLKISFGRISLQSKKRELGHRFRLEPINDTDGVYFLIHEATEIDSAPRAGGLWGRHAPHGLPCQTNMARLLNQLNLDLVLPKGSSRRNARPKVDSLSIDGMGIFLFSFGFPLIGVKTELKWKFYDQERTALYLGTGAVCLIASVVVDFSILVSENRQHHGIRFLDFSEESPQVRNICQKLLDNFFSFDGQFESYLQAQSKLIRCLRQINS